LPDRVSTGVLARTFTSDLVDAGWGGWQLPTTASITKAKARLGPEPRGRYDVGRVQIRVPVQRRAELGPHLDVAAAVALGDESSVHASGVPHYRGHRQHDHAGAVPAPYQGRTGAVRAPRGTVQMPASTTGSTFQVVTHGISRPPASHLATFRYDRPARTPLVHGSAVRRCGGRMVRVSSARWSEGGFREQRGGSHGPRSGAPDDGGSVRGTAAGPASCATRR